MNERLWYVTLDNEMVQEEGWKFATVLAGGALAVSNISPDQPEVLYAPGGWLLALLDEE